MRYDRVVLTGHALQRMFERRLRPNDVVRVISVGEVIADYPDDLPLPSRLMLGFIEGQAVHVVMAADDEAKTCYVITVYRPDPALWDADFRRRRSR